MKRVITFGTFDLLHIGHIKIFERAKKMGTELIVGVSSDALNYQKKNLYPVYSEEQRLEIVRSIRHVDCVFLEESLELKKEYVLHYGADLLVMGGDWKGKFDWCKDVCEVHYLSRTPDISSTLVKKNIIEAPPILKSA